LHCAPKGERLAVNVFLAPFSFGGAVQLKGWGWGDRRYGGYFCTITYLLGKTPKIAILLSFIHKEKQENGLNLPLFHLWIQTQKPNTSPQLSPQVEGLCYLVLIEG
jgi:hypothetical protein